MSRTRQIPLERRRFEPGVVRGHRARVREDRQLLVGDPDEVLEHGLRGEHADVGQAPERRLPVPLQVVEHLRACLQDVRDHAGPVLVGHAAAAPIQIVGARRRPVRRGDDPDPVVAAVPVRREPLERRHHVVDRPRVAHGGAPDLVGQVVGQPREEPLVRLVDVDVLVAADQPERRAHPDVLVGLQRRPASEVGHPRTPVVHVDRRGLPALDRVDQPPQHARVQVVLLDVADASLHEDVRALEDELVQAGPDRELRVVVRVHEARQHEVRAGAEHPVERSLPLELRARAGSDDRRPLDDQRAVRDQRPVAERDDRIAEDERAHRASYVGTTMRSSTAWNARFASCSTLGSSIVVNAWSR